jgi:protein DA1
MAPGFRSDPVVDQTLCAVCRARLGGGWWETPLGERFCPTHEHAPACRACAVPMRATGALCTRCVSTAVGSQQRVKAVLPEVRGGLHAMGLRLTTPIRVRLVTDGEMVRLNDGRPGTVLGLTVVSDSEVVDLAVVGGLSAPEFGAVVAHECMHAWLAQRGFGILAPPIAEGLCELASDAWLGRQHDPRARLLRNAIAGNPDPVYGDGFRRVRQAVRRHGFLPVLRAVRTARALP